MIQVLCEYDQRFRVEVAVARAKRQFLTAGHTQGHTPRAVVFNPAQAPEAATVAGLTVYTDKDVPLNRVRVCVVWIPSRQVAYEAQ